MFALPLGDPVDGPNCIPLPASPAGTLPAAELQLLTAEERLEALQAAGLSAAQVEDVETMLSGGWE